MPRKKATPEEVPAVTEETTPKRRGAPKSELAAAARVYETAKRKYQRVLETWEKRQEAADEAKAKLDKLVADRDAAKEALEKALQS